jgi:hypothetical protein
MRILFDHGTPSGIARSLAGHEVTEAIERGWDRISNGGLLTTAEAAGFELLLTTDKNIRYQQNSKGRNIAGERGDTWQLCRGRNSLQVHGAAGAGERRAAGKTLFCDA